LKFLSESLRGLGMDVVPSDANFIMVVLSGEEQAQRMAHDLMAQGVIVRPLKSFGLPQCIRISTGTDDDNHRCIETIQKLSVAAQV
jgi:histidinol-phosphate aminotransferase